MSGEALVRDKEAFEKGWMSQIPKRRLRRAWDGATVATKSYDVVAGFWCMVRLVFEKVENGGILRFMELY